MTDARPDLIRLLDAARFAAEQHRDQRRKGANAYPYINHPIAVAASLASDGGVTDVVLLMGALLHDTIEDTGTTGEEIERRFGADVRRLVEEVSDDKRLPKEDRKQLQISRAPSLSQKAKQIKLADLADNVNDVSVQPVPSWSVQRRSDYLDWAQHVVDGCRGANAGLEARFDAVLAASRRAVG